MTAQKPAADKAKQDTGSKTSDTSPKTSDTAPATQAAEPKISDTGMVGDVTPEAKQPTKRAERRKAEDGRPACRIHDVFDTVPQCDRPEFVEDAGLCGAHYSLFPNARKAAARD